MKLIILAAGQGSRLAPLTNEKPKTMVELWGKPMIDHIIETAGECGISDIVVVGGYEHEMLFKYLGGKVKKMIVNSEFDRTNMVASLFCASEEFTGDMDVIVSYSDIVYDVRMLEALMMSPSLGVSVVVDNNWELLWRNRMEDPLADAESLKIGNDGKLMEIGKQPNSLDDVDAQYVGLFKVSREFASDFTKTYGAMDRKVNYDGKEFPQMYMTSFIQYLIDRFNNVVAVPVHGGWVEVDCHMDLQSYESYSHGCLRASI